MEDCEKIYKYREDMSAPASSQQLENDENFIIATSYKSNIDKHNFIVHNAKLRFYISDMRLQFHDLKQNRIKIGKLIDDYKSSSVVDKLKIDEQIQKVSSDYDLLKSNYDKANECFNLYGNQFNAETINEMIEFRSTMADIQKDVEAENGIKYWHMLNDLQRVAAFNALSQQSDVLSQSNAYTQNSYEVDRDYFINRKDAEYDELNAIISQMPQQLHDQPMDISQQLHDQPMHISQQLHDQPLDLSHQFHSQMSNQPQDLTICKSHHHEEPSTSTIFYSSQLVDYNDTNKSPSSSNDTVIVMQHHNEISTLPKSTHDLEHHSSTSSSIDNIIDTISKCDDIVISPNSRRSYNVMPKLTREQRNIIAVSSITVLTSANFDRKIQMNINVQDHFSKEFPIRCAYFKVLDKKNNFVNGWLSPHDLTNACRAISLGFNEQFWTCGSCNEHKETNINDLRNHWVKCAKKLNMMEQYCTKCFDSHHPPCYRYSTALHPNDIKCAYAVDSDVPINVSPLNSVYIINKPTHNYFNELKFEADTYSFNRTRYINNNNKL